MKKILNISVFSLFLILSFIFTQKAFAACPLSPAKIYISHDSETLTISNAYTTNFDQIDHIDFYCNDHSSVTIGKSNITKLSNNKSVKFTVQQSGQCEHWGIEQNQYNPKPFARIYSTNNLICETNTISVVNTLPNQGDLCDISITPATPQAEIEVKATIKNIPSGTTDATLHKGIVQTFATTYESLGAISNNQTRSIGSFAYNTTVRVSVTGTYQGENYGTDKPLCSGSFVVGKSGLNDDIDFDGSAEPIDICSFMQGGKRDDCKTCMTNNGIYTDFGCIPGEPQAFVEIFLQIAIAIAGGIAFLMIVVGSFNIMASGGNPEKLNAGKEIVTAAIAGLLLIIFAVIIMKIIGIDILNLPGIG